jgi:hypothetical protein
VARESSSVQPTARILLDDLDELFRRAFAGRTPIDLTHEEIELVNRVLRGMREAK